MSGNSFEFQLPLKSSTQNKMVLLFAVTKSYLHKFFPKPVNALLYENAECFSFLKWNAFK